MFKNLPNTLIRVDLLASVEMVFILAALGLAFFFPGKILPVWRKFLRGLDTLARRPGLAVLLVGLLAFGGSMAVSLLVRFPQPAVQDEFSYLLAADTFAHARLTNPPHPLWRHFETVHVIQQPTYASKYQPAQGLVLALGQAVGGHPVVGVWLGVALACAAVCWMLQGWVPRRWALFGGLVAALNLGFFGYWSQNYWGGAMAATGGALLFGALRRLMLHPAPGNAVVLAVGLVILANSRPFEGLLVALPAAAVIGVGMVRAGGRSRNPWITRVALPVLAVCLLAGLWMGYYHFRVTGSPWRMPYQVYENHYPSTPIFLWSEKPPVQNLSLPQIFNDLQQAFWPRQRYMQTLEGYMRWKANDLWNILFSYFHCVFLVPLIMLPRALRNRWTAFAAIVVVLVTGAAFLQTQSYPRKLAPATCLLVLLAVQCLRHLQFWRFHGRPVGKSWAALLIAVFGFSVLISFLPHFHAAPWPVSQQRAELEMRLSQESGLHVILVKLDPASYAYPHFTWVSNRADIDASKVIWAWDLGQEKNRPLCQYYQGRHIWLLEVGRGMVGRESLKPYNGSPG
jgi:hypothetical protein